MKKLQKAFSFACEKHYGQIRKGSGIPYLTHCIEVMKLLSDCGFKDENILCGAILHDTLEDCLVGHYLLVKEFGHLIANIVEECSREQVSREKETNFFKLQFLKSFIQVNEYGKFNKSKESVFIKIADRICNVNDYVKSGRKDGYPEFYALQAFHLFERLKIELENDPKNKAIRNLAFAADDCILMSRKFLGERRYGNDFDINDFSNYKLKVTDYLYDGETIDDIIINYEKRSGHE